MKRIAIMVFVLSILVLSLTGCGNTEESTTTEITTEVSSEEAFGYLDEAIDKYPDDIKYSIDICEAIVNPDKDTLYVNIKVKYLEKMGYVAEYVTKTVESPSEDYTKSDITLRYSFEDGSVCTWHSKDNKTGMYIDTSKDPEEDGYAEDDVSIDRLKELVK